MDEKDEPHRNLRFLVKWQNYSHIHDTWETYEHLKRFKGFKRVENYIKNIFWPQQLMFNNPEVSREDLEALHIERERQADQLKGYSQVERIIAQRDAAANEDVDHDHSTSSLPLHFVSIADSHLLLHSSVEYLCKWRGLQYSDATWENYDSISGDEIAAAAIESFLAREASPCLPAKSANYNKGRPTFRKITEEPAYVSKCGSLKDFQIVGLNWMAYLWSKGDNGILADEVRFFFSSSTL